MQLKTLWHFPQVKLTGVHVVVTDVVLLLFLSPYRLFFLHHSTKHLCWRLHKGSQLAEPGMPQVCLCSGGVTQGALGRLPVFQVPGSQRPLTAPDVRNRALPKDPGSTTAALSAAPSIANISYTKANFSWIFSTESLVLFLLRVFWALHWFSQKFSSWLHPAWQSQLKIFFCTCSTGAVFWARL